MSQENIERGRQAFAALNRRDLDAFLEFMDPEAEINTRLTALEGRSYHGLDGTREWWRDMLAVFPDFNVEILEVRDYEPFLIGLVHARGHGLDSGAPFDMTLWQAVDIHRGKVVWWQMFGSEVEALRAVRKREQTMSRENVDMVRRANDAFNRGDRAAWLECFDPDAEMVPFREWPENASVRGPDAIWDAYADFTDAWDVGAFELAEVIAVGPNRVIANARRRAKGRASGVNLVFDYWLVSSSRNRRIVRAEWFAGRVEALEAAEMRG